MENHTSISDEALQKLLKQSLLEHADDNLLEAEAKIVFASKPAIAPPAVKEKVLIKNSRVIGLKLILLITGVAAISGGIIYYMVDKPTDEETVSHEKVTTTVIHPVTKEPFNNQWGQSIADKDTSRNNFTKKIQGSLYHGQIIEKIVKENADCASPILVRDTIVFSPHTPKGFGNDLEIHDNPEDDLMYFENEHNTIWYKFSAWETGQLTFDIIPVDPNDDYDFMLYKWTGGDFRSNIMNKKVTPLRTCISRNDKKLKGRTGLLLDESLPPYVHSGVGDSYVKYMNVQKGETFYLLVDNVYNNGNGHTIHFHYKPIKPGEPYVGKKNVLTNVTFKDSDDEFKPGTNYIEAIDSLYNFLIENPGVKIEVQGHVNTNLHNKLGKVDGKPYRNDRQLSQLRAEAVCKLLYKKGIDPERLSPYGYGGAMKKIPNPKTKEECYKNIRVEVLIMSLDYKRDPEYIKKHKKQK
ncbi:MAG TPA: OmpA family protein [Bacteroidia bacterium]|jgi:chemotaxis protein MotB|nr:OmpA family protein [Bacteroidia bacterium]